jgi:hypothetical protein
VDGSRRFVSLHLHEKRDADAYNKNGRGWVDNSVRRIVQLVFARNCEHIIPFSHRLLLIAALVLQCLRSGLSRYRGWEIRGALVTSSLSCPSIRVGDVVLRSTWFTQDDVNILKGAGINTVRIPVRTVMPLSAMAVLLLSQLGYWIVESLVDRNTESYPRGGIKFLVGFTHVKMFKN